MKKVKVEIWSDVVCPFCYIGKRKFEAAVEKMSLQNQIEVEWKCFQLDPTTVPNEKIDVFDYLATRYGKDREWSVQMHKSVVEQAKSVGLEYNFDKAKITNTHKAHQLAQLAKSINQGDALEELLFQAYFTEGKDLNKLETLIELGEKVGLSSDDIRYNLEKQVYFQAVEQDIEEAQTIGVKGVPFFVFDRIYAISGAQDVSVFQNTLEKILEEN